MNFKRTYPLVSNFSRSITAILRALPLQGSTGWQRLTLPGLIGYRLDIAVQGQFFETVFTDTDTAEPPQALRIHYMKGQFFVSEVIEDLDNGAAQNLISAHAFYPAC